MTTELSVKKQKKSARTPEEQAARDARKAAKAAGTPNATASSTVEGEAPAESSTQAVKARDNVTDGSSKSVSKKRRRDTDGEEDQNQEEDDEDLLEIDVDAPEPLSKAEARAAKKRAKKGLPEAKPEKPKTEKKTKRDADDGESDSSDGEGEKKKEKTETKRQNSIWIGNLAFKTTQETLRLFFENAIEEAGMKKEGCITRVNMPKKAGKGQFATANKGFAYVDFKTPEMQAIAVGLSESFFEGRKLLIKLGNDHTAQPDARTPKPIKEKLDPIVAGILKRQQHPESSTLFVGNLGFDATEDGLRDFIEGNAADRELASKKQKEADNAGASDEEETEEKDEEEEPVNPNTLRGGKKSGMRKVRLGAFEDTGRCKGFAFLDFHTPEDATKTLTNRHNHFFGGRKLNLQYASAEATKRSGGGTRQDKDKPKAEGKSPYKPRPEAAGAEGYVDIEKDGEQIREQTEEVDPRRKEKDERGKKWQTTGRPRPGAALAMAKRENVAIVKGEGEKIVFD